jgi:hypothetical protein
VEQVSPARTALSLPKLLWPLWHEHVSGRKKHVLDSKDLFFILDPLFSNDSQQQGVHTDGDQDAFISYAHVWRRVLELARTAHNDNKRTPLNADPPESTDIIGRYVWIDAPGWGRAKVFYESAGNGPQQVLFMHTAGSDSRQYHAVMETKAMQERCTMYAFDLPAHGRSFPVPGVYPGGHGLDEEKYIGVTKAMIKALNLTKPVIAGASMAGQLMLNIAVRAKEFPPLAGVIPMQGAELVALDLPDWCRSPKYNQSLFAPECELLHHPKHEMTN